MMQLYLYEARALVKKAATEAIDSFATGRRRFIYQLAINTMLRPYDVNPKALRRNIAGFVVENQGYCF